MKRENSFDEMVLWKMPNYLLLLAGMLVDIPVDSISCDNAACVWFAEKS